MLKSYLLSVAVSALFLCSAAGTENAETIYQATGVQGGLVVHLQCGDGTLTAALGAGDSYLVQGLDTEKKNVDAARKHIQSRGLYGKVSVIHLNDGALPYNNNLVNLIVGSKPATISNQEIMRVLAPNGVAYLKEGSRWKMQKKAVPAESDDWTHYLHGPDNNAVSQDTIVSHPYHIQWAGLPNWTRNHNHLNGYSALVSANGRIFYILDDGPLQSVRYPPRWNLVARDAYNGVVLWKKTINRWEGHLRRFRSGPTELPRRLVAVGDRVYVTLGYGRPLSIIDAATGRLIKEVPGTEGTHEIICSGKQLYLVAGEMDERAYRGTLKSGAPSPIIQTKRIIAVNKDTGRTLWTKADEDTREMLPTTLCANAGGLYFHSPKQLIRLDRDNGKTKWKTERLLEKNRLSWGAPTLVLYQDLVLSAEGKHSAGNGRKRKKSAASEETESVGISDIKWNISSGPRSSEGGELIVYRAQDGKELWRCPAAFGYSSPPNLFVANGLVWVSAIPGINNADMGEGRDPYTGEIKQHIDMEFAFDAAHHHRCYRDKATDNFMLLGRTGVEFIDLKDETVQRHYWIRGTCQYGVMPANGLLYLPGHSCACYVQSKLNGFWALAPKRHDNAANDTGRLVKGPAYGTNVPIRPTSVTDWPMLRHDVQRSSLTKASLSGKPRLAWRTKLVDQDGLTSPVIAGSLLLTALKERHEVVCLNVETGAVAWRFTTGGKIDSPPALYKGRALVGSHDGYLYCLNLADGKMRWKFRAAPQERQTVAFGQVESVWPLVGSVLVHKGSVYCTAGRTSYLDGGITLFVLDPESGREINRNQFYSRDAETGEQPDALLEDVELPGTLPDILTVEGDSIFLRDKKLDDMGREVRPGQYGLHLYSSAGLLNDEWWHRTIWIWGKRAFGRASGWSVAGKYNPSGRFLVLDGPNVYGYKFTEGRGAHALFCASKEVEKVDRKLKNNNAAVVKYVTPDKPVYRWNEDLDMAVRAMLLTENNIYAAGPVAEEVILFDTVESEARLSVFSKKDGSRVSHTKLPAQPVFDGMAAANGKIFLALINGEIVCYR